MGALFVTAAARVFWRERQEQAPGHRVLRVSHNYLHDNMREAFADLAREFEALHPGLRVVVLEIPRRVEDAWQRTQLSGGTPPDIMQISLRMADEDVAAHFRPITGEVLRGNPYNAGTALDGVPWKDTFLDGLTSPQTYYANLLEYYGIPPFAATARVFVNLKLHEEVAPGEPLPRTYDDFIRLARTVAQHAQERKRLLMAVAGSDDNASMLLGRFFSQQTQQLSLALHHDLSLDWGGAPGSAMTAAAYLRGEWSLDQGAVLTGWQLLREVSQVFQPGFLQTHRDNATFHFVQGNAVMIVSGSWDTNALIRQAPFPVAVIPLPLPTKDHPRFGAHLLGPIAEGSGFVSYPFAVTTRAQEPELAVDFLRYLTSVRANQRFAAKALRVPIVVGVEPAPEVAAFAPVDEGYPQEFSPEFISFANRGLNMAFLRNLHLLVAPEGGVEPFLAALDDTFDRAARIDLQRYVSDGFRVLQRGDSVAAAHHWRGLAYPEEPDRSAVFFERQHLQEAEYLQLRRALVP